MDRMRPSKSPRQNKQIVRQINGFHNSISADGSGDFMNPTTTITGGRLGGGATAGEEGGSQELDLIEAKKRLESLHSSLPALSTTLQLLGEPSRPATTKAAASAAASSSKQQKLRRRLSEPAVNVRRTLSPQITNSHRRRKYFQQSNSNDQNTNNNHPPTPASQQQQQQQKQPKQTFGVRSLYKRSTSSSSAHSKDSEAKHPTQQINISDGNHKPNSTTATATATTTATNRQASEVQAESFVSLTTSSTASTSSNSERSSLKNYNNHHNNNNSSNNNSSYSFHFSSSSLSMNNYSSSNNNSGSFRPFTPPLSNIIDADDDGIISGDNNDNNKATDGFGPVVVSPKGKKLLRNGALSPALTIGSATTIKKTGSASRIRRNVDPSQQIMIPLQSSEDTEDPFVPIDDQFGDFCATTGSPSLRSKKPSLTTDDIFLPTKTRLWASMSHVSPAIMFDHPVVSSSTLPKKKKSNNNTDADDAQSQELLLHPNDKKSNNSSSSVSTNSNINNNNNNPTTGSSSRNNNTKDSATTTTRTRRPKGATKKKSSNTSNSTKHDNDNDNDIKPLQQRQKSRSLSHNNIRHDAQAQPQPSSSTPRSSSPLVPSSGDVVGRKKKKKHPKSMSMSHVSQVVETTASSLWLANQADHEGRALEKKQEKKQAHKKHPKSMSMSHVRSIEAVGDNEYQYQSPPAESGRTQTRNSKAKKSIRQKAKSMSMSHVNHGLTIDEMPLGGIRAVATSGSLENSGEGRDSQYELIDNMPLKGAKVLSSNKESKSSGHIDYDHDDSIPNDGGGVKGNKTATKQTGSMSTSNIEYNYDDARQSSSTKSKKKKIARRKSGPSFPTIEEVKDHAKNILNSSFSSLQLSDGPDDAATKESNAAISAADFIKARDDFFLSQMERMNAMSSSKYRKSHTNAKRRNSLPSDPMSMDFNIEDETDRLTFSDHIQNIFDSEEDSTTMPSTLGETIITDATRSKHFDIEWTPPASATEETEASEQVSSVGGPRRARRASLPASMKDIPYEPVTPVFFYEKGRQKDVTGHRPDSFFGKYQPAEKDEETELLVHENPNDKNSDNVVTSGKHHETAIGTGSRRQNQSYSDRRIRTRSMSPIRSELSANTDLTTRAEAIPRRGTAPTLKSEDEHARNPRNHSVEVHRRRKPSKTPNGQSDGSRHKTESSRSSKIRGKTSSSVESRKNGTDPGDEHKNSASTRESTPREQRPSKSPRSRSNSGAKHRQSFAPKHSTAGSQPGEKSRSKKSSSKSRSSSTVLESTTGDDLDTATKSRGKSNRHSTAPQPQLSHGERERSNPKTKTATSSEKVSSDGGRTRKSTGVKSEKRTSKSPRRTRRRASVGSTVSAESAPVLGSNIGHITGHSSASSWAALTVGEGRKY